MSTPDDLDIARNVENVLWWTGYWRGNDIRVTVKNGWVTLSGELDWAYQKRLAVPVVRDLAGILGITDNLVVKFVQGTPDSAADDGRTRPDLVTSSRWS